MPVVVGDRNPFYYYAKYARKGHEKLEFDSGTVYAESSEAALSMAESKLLNRNHYGVDAGQLSLVSIEVKSVWKLPDHTDAGRTRYYKTNAPQAAQTNLLPPPAEAKPPRPWEYKPPPKMTEIEGIGKYVNLLEPDVKPFTVPCTYKENSNET